ncbi:MAG TPA: zinc-ribbon domain-containing protein [Steroidobacteraceae bacterium]|jgi:hypothetical protein|nr:zinc-ribbon domain-containing protein [Steroidobacteraceae bacterium]
MAGADLNELEQQARALHDPKDREEALKAIAELRAMREGRFQLPNPPTPPSPPPSFPPDVREVGRNRLAAAVKLLIGTLAFLALCVSLVSLVLPIGVLLDGDATAPTYWLLSAAASAVLVSAIVLWLAARQPRAQREAITQDPVARHFARQKLFLAFSTGGLMVLNISAMVVILRAERDLRFLIYVVMFAFLFGTWMLSRAFWRCPKCGNSLPISVVRFDGSCPYCRTRFS